MKINLIAIGNRMPIWVNKAYQTYATRLPHDNQLNLIEIATSKRTKNCVINKILIKEGEQILGAIEKRDKVIALDERGKLWNTLQLAEQLQQWREQSSYVTLLIGGPDGLAESCKQRASEHWSLSPLTLPHPLVRVIVAEQLYRAWTIINHHPYHRQ
ncbi:MAG: 23S rRNA (pseudouridine(1915)-N(3))-methyltransferase RlmH [Gammaproteobacteria bacterium]|nr:23S rRNA (pseudouridine(1915)-N(3))-methyltransferase RlmH [Gammaproteobacteria bacterium]